MAYQSRGQGSAPRKGKSTKEKKAKALVESRGKEILGAVVAFLGLLAWAMLFSYTPSDPNFMRATDGAVQNWLGRIGASLSHPLFMVVGKAAWLIPLALLVWGGRVLWKKGDEGAMARAPFVPVAMAIGAVFFATLAPEGQGSYTYQSGGMLGYTVLSMLLTMAPIGASFITGIISAVLFVLWAGLSLYSLGITKEETMSFGARLLGLTLAGVSWLKEATGKSAQVSKTLSGTLSNGMGTLGGTVQGKLAEALQKRQQAQAAKAAAAPRLAAPAPQPQAYEDYPEDEAQIFYADEPGPAAPPLRESMFAPSLEGQRRTAVIRPVPPPPAQMPEGYEAYQEQEALNALDWQTAEVETFQAPYEEPPRYEAPRPEAPRSEAPRPDSPRAEPRHGFEATPNAGILSRAQGLLKRSSEFTPRLEPELVEREPLPPQAEFVPDDARIRSKITRAIEARLDGQETAPAAPAAAPAPLLDPARLTGRGPRPLIFDPNARTQALAAARAVQRTEPPLTAPAAPHMAAPAPFEAQAPVQSVAQAVVQPAVQAAVEAVAQAAPEVAISFAHQSRAVAQAPAVVAAAAVAAVAPAVAASLPPRPQRPAHFDPAAFVAPQAPEAPAAAQAAPVLPPQAQRPAMVMPPILPQPAAAAPMFAPSAPEPSPAVSFARSSYQEEQQSLNIFEGDLSEDVLLEDGESWDEAPVVMPRLGAGSIAPAASQPFSPPAPITRGVIEKAAPTVRPSRFADYELPPLALLTDPADVERHHLPDEQLEENARLLETVLEDYGIKGEIVSVRPGPVVTMYELEPAPGLKASRVIGLADDIARSMSALSARVSTVPGRTVIGIELPNANREKVVLREILNAREFGAEQMRLPLALGKDIGGEAVVANLAKMPHLLIAGTTGSGKSVAINTMILSLLYKLSPDECRLIMIDPKMLELSVYDGIPHLLSPVVTDPKKAVVALKWVVAEMEERYRKMSKMGVRNIDGYNGRVRDALSRGEMFERTVQTGFDDETGDPIFETESFQPQLLPYIVVVVDEMADLMMVAGKEIEACIQRLAQMARASGIHLIMATQRPSVDVITGTIKANFPTRISFQVTSKIDSRTILGEQGAEQLLGMGDMLYMAGGGRVTRVHGPFVSDEEVEEIVNYLKAYGPPEYTSGVVEGPEDDMEADIDAVLGLAPSGNTTGDDALYDQAVAIVARDRKCSTSYIQRKLGIGYNKAARLVEQMEEQGVVSPANHVGKREILLPEQ